METQSLGLISLIKTIKNYSRFGNKKIRPEFLREIIECASFAPSTNDPWRITVVQHPTVKAMLSEVSIEYSEIFETADCIIVVFLDIERSLDRVKDLLAMGAFIENILLGIHAIPEMGAFWIEDILNVKEQINQIFKLPPSRFELMAVIAVGALDDSAIPDKFKQNRIRRSVELFTDWL